MDIGIGGCVTRYGHDLRAGRPFAWRGALAGCAVALLVGALAASAGAADRVYWIDDNSLGAVRDAALNGTGSAQDLFTGEHYPGAVAIDPAAGKIYWSTSTSGSIRVANLDGSGSAQDLFLGEGDPYGVAIDPAAGKIYWANASPGAIRVGNLNGTGSPHDLFSGEDDPVGVAIDPVAGKIYWANDAPTGAIRVGNLNGTGSAHDLFPNEGFAWGVAIDPATGKIYWPSQGTGSMRVANLNGSGSAHDMFTGETNPVGVAIDPAAGKIYWATSAGAIRVANLNGSGSAQDLVTGESSPQFPVLLRAPVGAGGPRIAGGSGAGSVLSCSQGQWAADLVGGFLYRAPRSFVYRWTLNGAPLPGANSNALTASAAGVYACQVFAVNGAGFTSQTSAERAVLATISSLKAKITHHAAKFTFKAAPGATGFRCALIKLKRGKKPQPHFKSCKSPKSYKRLKHGKYKFEVRAVSGAGPGLTRSKSFAI